MNLLAVACALLLHEGKVLATQRSATMDLPGSWEFPGGKVEEGESPEACLIRELREELALEVQIGRPLSPVDHHYPHKSIRLLPYLATWTSGHLVLAEHAQHRWLDKKDLFTLDWAPADLPIVHELAENWLSLVGTT